MDEFTIKLPIEQTNKLLSDYVESQNVEVLEVILTPAEPPEKYFFGYLELNREDAEAEFRPTLSRVSYSLMFRSSREPTKIEISGLTPNERCILNVVYPLFPVYDERLSYSERNHRQSMRLLQGGEVPESVMFHVKVSDGDDMIWGVSLRQMRAVLAETDSYVIGFLDTLASNLVIPRDLELALDLVGSDWREAVTMMYEGHDISSIATKMNVGNKTVSNRLWQLRRDFKKTQGYKLPF